MTAGSQALSHGEGANYDNKKVLPLDPSLYEVDHEFFSALTGITDPEELKKHILKVQAEAYAVHPYPCIRIFHFATTKISRYSAYEQLLKLGRERPGAIFLDIGCGVGNDIRRAVLDGYPANQIIGSDLHPEFWDIGHKLFKSTPESFPAAFVAGNVFEPSFLERKPIVTAETAVEPLAQPLSSLTTLTPLIGRVSAIHASSFFHLFDEERQTHLAELLGSLLSPEPGSMIFGAHVGRPEKGFREEAQTPGRSVSMFCHNEDSWRQLWLDTFGEGKVEVKAAVREIERRDYVRVKADAKFWALIWSVKRL